MHQYLTDTRYASQTLVETIYNEEIILSTLIIEYEKVAPIYEYLYQDFRESDGAEDVDDAQLMNKFIKMARFNEREDVLGKHKQVNFLQDSIKYKQESISSLAMSLLQIAKQGISIVHGTLPACPTGRMLNHESLKNIIWQARNQAIHYEEGNPHPPVRACFANLTNDYGQQFDITIAPVSNKSKMVLDLLGWQTYTNYENDMESLLG